MARTIDWTRQARTDLKRLGRQDSDRIRGAVRRLAASGQGDVEHLKGSSQPRFRLRVGSWRVMFRTKDGSLSIVRVLHRRDAYRKSGLIRQDIPGADGFDGIVDGEMPASTSE